MEKDFLETWEIHQRINLYLLDSVHESTLKDISSSKGRNVGEQFAHIHNVRMLWLMAAKPELLKGLEKIEKEKDITKSLLKKSLTQSSKAIASLLETSIKEGRIKGFKPHPMAFLGYIISHESHHRGQIMLCLKQSGHPADKKVGFGMWEWGVR
ncbi:DinB family protein [soil metagenome]